MKQQIQSDPARMRELIAKLIPQADGDQAERFVRYYVMLIERNNVMNLTAITDPDGVAGRHFADSLVAAAELAPGAKVLDVGTGAGFPGIPLLIMRPDLELTLLDSLNKRILFLNDVISELGLSCRAIHSRAEDGGRSEELRGQFDAVLTRAVAELSIAAEWTLPFAKTGGKSIMYKGPGAQEELGRAQNALRILRAEARIVRFDLPWGERNLVIAQKIGPTPPKYPRKAGTASKNPL